MKSGFSMKSARVITLAVVACVLGALSRPAWGQTTVFGKDLRDKILPAGMSQNQNANTIVEGINANATAKLNSARLADTLDGKIYSGTLEGTNRFVLRVYDTNLVALQVFEFTFNGGQPVTTNGVSRIGYPETNLFKVLDRYRIQSNGTWMAGVPVAQGSTGYVAVVTPLWQTNRIYIQKDWAWAQPANYIEVKHGVVSAIQ